MKTGVPSFTAYPPDNPVAFRQTGNLPDFYTLPRVRLDYFNSQSG